jgi:hypothetical protein
LLVAFSSKGVGNLALLLLFFSFACRPQRIHDLRGGGVCRPRGRNC